MKQWYVLHSKPKKESFAGALLRRAGIEVCVPQVKVKKQRNIDARLEPFFPGYFFSRLDSALGEIRMASYTSGVLYVVGFGGEPSPVPDQLVLSIQERLARAEGETVWPGLQVGDRVVVSAGPLSGIEAVFDGHLSSDGRVQVLINLLKRVWRAQVHIGQLERVNQAAGIA